MSFLCWMLHSPPVRCPFPDISYNVVQAIPIGRKCSDLQKRSSTNASSLNHATFSKVFKPEDPSAEGTFTSAKNICIHISKTNKLLVQSCNTFTYSIYIKLNGRMHWYHPLCSQHHEGTWHLLISFADRSSKEGHCLIKHRPAHSICILSCVLMPLTSRFQFPFPPKKSKSGCQLTHVQISPLIKPSRLILIAK